jgi:NTP pyrophosphatase (non-canonical NTP hydrolase)
VRDWERFHTPKNLSMALVAEAGELVEQFQWLTADECMSLSDEQRAAVADEVADVLIYLVRLADVLEIDLLGAADAKIERNERRFPAPPNET